MTAAVSLVPVVPGGMPLIGHLNALRNDPLKLITRMREHGKVSRVRVGPYNYFLAAHPDAVQHVLVDHAKRYDRKTFAFEKARIVMGNGLITVREHESWLKQRRIAQRVFRRDGEIVGHWAESMSKIAGRYVARWERYAASGEVIDMVAEGARISGESLGASLFGFDLAEEAVGLGEAALELGRMGYARARSLLEVPLYIPTPANIRWHRAAGKLDDLVHRIIAKRRSEASAAGAHDVVALYLRAKDDVTGEGLSARQIRDELLTFLLAGEESTANTFSWISHCLSRHPDVDRRLAEEASRVLSGRAATLADLPKLTYTTSVIEESMRLFPPFWLIERRATQDDEICGVHIPKHSFIINSPYVTHRHPDVWEDPMRYDPERFAPGKAATYPKCAFFPFGAGPHLCIGKHFAMMEMTIFLATLAQHFRVEAVAKPKVVPVAAVTLHPKYGVPLRIVSRRAA